MPGRVKLPSASAVVSSCSLALSRATHRQSLEDPAQWWAKAAADIAWFEFPPLLRDKKSSSSAPLSQVSNDVTVTPSTTSANSVFTGKLPVGENVTGLDRLFDGGKLNTGYLCSDVHVHNGRGSQPAIIFESPLANVEGGGVSRQLSYLELSNESSLIAGGLKQLGVKKGDVVLISMPTIPEAISVMLGCAKLGAIHAVVFGGFAPSQLAVRIAAARPVVVITCRYAVEAGRNISYKPLVDEAIAAVSPEHRPSHVLVVDREGEGIWGDQMASESLCKMDAPRDVLWSDLKKKVTAQEAVPVDAKDPLYILYTSGTTAQPKGVVRENGGHAVALKWSMRHIMGCQPGDVYFSASDIGWVVGHSYAVYGPLLLGSTTVLFEGKPVNSPDAGAFWRVVEKHKVEKMFTAPSGIRAIIKEDPSGSFLKQFNLSSLKALFLAGERLDPTTAKWLQMKLPAHTKPLDQWWQTETGWAIASTPYLLVNEENDFPTKEGSAGVMSPSFDVKILSDAGEELEANVEGNIALKLPLPPAAATTLYRDYERYYSSYLQRFPGYYDTGDGGYVDQDGYVTVLGRTDDVLTVAGHRLSTGALEAAISKHPHVAEVAVCGVHDSLKTEMPVAFVILKQYSGTMKVATEKIRRQIKLLVRREVSSIASLKEVVFISSLPKTRSGKILRRAIRDMTDKELKDVVIPSTIEDVSVIKQIKEVINSHNIGPLAKQSALERSREILCKTPNLQNGFEALICSRDQTGEVTTKFLENASVDDLPSPHESANVTVRVTHTTINYKDGIVMSGRPGVATTWPIVPGIDFAGVVLEAASDSSYVAGDQVILTGQYAGQHCDGGFSQVVRIPSRWLVPLDAAGLTPCDAMAIGTAGFTAMQAVDTLERAGLSPDDPAPILVTGAGGGVGGFAIAILSHLGYNVCASTTRADSLRDYMHSLGASKVISRLEASKRPLEKEEFSAAIDSVGGDTLKSVLSRIQYGGSVATCGNAGTAELESTVFPFILRGISLMGIDSVQLPEKERLKIWKRFRNGDAPLDAIRKIAYRRISLKEVPSIIPDLMKGKVQGRVVVEL